MTARQTAAAAAAARPLPHAELPGQVVLVLQGGGALGAYQVGVYEALHDAGIEPEWVIGTSIGAINAALIAGNPPGQRLERLNDFWRHVELPGSVAGPFDWLGMGNLVANMTTVMRGIPAFFEPNLAALREFGAGPLAVRLQERKQSEHPRGGLRHVQILRAFRTKSDLNGKYRGGTINERTTPWTGRSSSWPSP